VLPPEFVFPGHPEVDVLVPLALDEASEHARARQKIVQVIGRRAPGASPEQVRAELKAIQSEATAQAPHAPRDGMTVTGSAPDAFAPRPLRDVPAEAAPAPNAPPR